MNIARYNKAQILASLYNGSVTIGLGMIQYKPGEMTEKEAQILLDSGRKYFDYLQGRVMKIDLSNNELSTYLYNRDNGENAAESIIEQLPFSKDEEYIPFEDLKNNNQGLKKIS